MRCTRLADDTVMRELAMKDRESDCDACLCQ